MDKKESLKIIDQLLNDNDKKIIENTNSLARKHTLIFDYKIQKEKNEEAIKLLEQEKVTLSNYHQQFLKKFIPYMILPVVLLIGAVGSIAISAKAAISLLVLSGVMGIGETLKFNTKNREFLKLKRKSNKIIDQEIKTYMEKNKVLDTVITNTKDDISLLKEKYTKLNTARKELISQKQKNLYDNNTNESDIKKTKIKN